MCPLRNVRSAVLILGTSSFSSDERGESQPVYAATLELYRRLLPDRERILWWPAPASRT
jgi:hypothetical protein